MRRGSWLDHPGLLDQGEERRIHAGRAIWGRLQRALPGHGFPYSEVVNRIRWNSYYVRLLVTFLAAEKFALGRHDAAEEVLEPLVRTEVFEGWLPF